MDALPDSMLGMLAGKGHERAWRALVQRYRRLVYSVPSRFRLSGDDSEDVFQHTFLKFHQQLQKGDTPQHCARWLVTVARNESIRVIQFQGRSTDLDETLLGGEEDGSDDRLVALERAHVVHKGLERLRERCRELLTALYIQDEAYSDISTRLSIPLGAIGPTRARCLEQLRKLIPHDF